MLETISSSLWAHLDIVILVVGVILIDSGFVWVQGKAVPRADGELVPWWWVMALGIAYGPATIAIAFDGWARTIGAWTFFLVGLMAWPVARWVDNKRKVLANFAEDGRDLHLRRHFRSGPDLEASIQILQECEDASVDEVSRWTADSPAARHAVSRWDAKRAPRVEPEAVKTPTNGVSAAS